MAESKSNAEDGAQSTAPPKPVRALLYWFKLTTKELVVIDAMLDIGDSTGQFLYPSVPRIAAYTKLSERAVQTVLHGDPRQCANCRCPAPYADKKNRPRNHRNSLCGRHVLEELAPGNVTTRKAATYRLHFRALEVDIDMIRSAIRNRWRVPPEIVDLCPEQIRHRMQTTLQFPPDEKDAHNWIRLHRLEWQRIQRELRTFSDVRLGHIHWTPATKERFVFEKAVEHGAPEPVAIAIAQIAAGTYKPAIMEETTT